MTGELQGHWEYVIAAYAITWLFFAGYTWSLWYRARTLASSDSRPGASISTGNTND